MLCSNDRRRQSSHVSPKVALTFSRSCIAIAALATLFALAMPILTKAAEIEPLSIETAGGFYDFTVEVMRTRPQLERGLMFRRSMPEYHGMLFLFPNERTVSMWMKNTFIPLDMIFIAKDGRVVGIIANAVPMSEQLLSVGIPVYAVLEVNAGMAAKTEAKVGDEVRFRRAAEAATAGEPTFPPARQKKRSIVYADARQRPT